MHEYIVLPHAEGHVRARRCGRDHPAGDGANGKGNRKGIQVEICYSKSGGTRFDQAEKNAAHFIATLLRERGWGIEKVKKHQDFRNKYCPHRTLDKGWNGFIQMIKSYLNDILKKKKYLKK